MSGGVPRPRIAPVNQALVTSVRLRDPRLMRQIQSQMQNQQQQNNTRPFMNGPRGRGPQSATVGRFSPTIGRQQFPSNFPHMVSNDLSQNTMTTGGSIDFIKMNRPIGNNAAATNNKDENNKSEKIRNVQNKPVSKSTGSSKTGSVTKSPNSKSGINSSSRSNSKSTSERTSVSTKISSSSSSSSSKDSKTRKDSRNSGSIRSSAGSSSNVSEKKRSSDGNLSSPTSSRDKIPLKSDSKITKSKLSSPSKLFKDLKSPSKHRNYIRRNRESSKSPTMNSTKGDQACISPIPPEPPRITEPIESSPVDKSTVVEVVISATETAVTPVLTTTISTSSSDVVKAEVTEIETPSTTDVSSQSVSTSDTEMKLATSVASVESESDTSKNLIVTSAINEVVHILLWISSLKRCINCNCCSLHLMLIIVVAVRTKFLCLIIKDNLLRSSIKQIVFYLQESNYSLYCDFVNLLTVEFQFICANVK